MEKEGNSDVFIMCLNQYDDKIVRAVEFLGLLRGYRSNVCVNADIVIIISSSLPLCFTLTR